MDSSDMPVSDHRELLESVSSLSDKYDWFGRESHDEARRGLDNRRDHRPQGFGATN
jgi:hypothetical protein